MPLLDLIAIFPDFGKIMVVAIISLFMPLTAISFFYFMIPKKEVDFDRAMDDMGIETNRKVSDIHSFRRYLLPVSFVSLICFFASTYFAFANTAVEGLKDSLLLTGAFFGGENNVPLIRQSLAVLSYAFFGSFIWSAQNIIRRLIAFDISPSVYYSAGVRIILASVVALVITFFLGREGSANAFSKSTITAIAFLTGMFPERFLQYLINFYQNLVNPDKLINNNLSLYRVEGVSMSHKERLQEVGIDNAQNLASTSLSQLCLETPFQSRELLDWMGQAKLLCYLKEDMDRLRKVGIRSAFDFHNVKRSPDQIKAIATAAEISPILLQNVYDQIIADNGIVKLSEFMYGINTPTGEKEATPKTTEAKSQ
ncbi:MAG: hypothetical protein AAF985_01945 [Bacteroidota bacterium]